MKKLRPGDIGLTTAPTLLARGIIWAQRLIDRFKDPVPYSHAFFVSHHEGFIYESAEFIGCNHLSKYVGKRVLIARPEMSRGQYDKGLEGIRPLIGKRYPAYRLALFLLGLADNLASGALVCSELVAKFLIFSGIGGFQDFRGVTPDDIEDASREKYEIIFEGVMTQTILDGLIRGE